MAVKAPKIIRGLSLTYKIIAGLMFFSGLLGFLMYSLITFLARQSPSGVSGFFEQSRLLSFILKNFAGLSLIQAVISGFIFYASIQFEKFQLWARNVLEVFSWALFCFILWFTIGSITYFPWNLPIVAKFIIAGGMGFWAIPVLILIGFLRKREVREAFKKPTLNSNI